MSITEDEMDNIYDELVNKQKLPWRTAERLMREAYVRYKEYVQKNEVQEFMFMVQPSNYEAFLFHVDQVVKVNGTGELGIVTGWCTRTSGKFMVRLKTARGERSYCPGDITTAEFPEGLLVEILRGRVHAKVDEAFE